MTDQEKELFKRSRQGKEILEVESDECKSIDVCIVNKESNIIVSRSVWRNITSKGRVERLCVRIGAELPVNEMAVAVSSLQAEIGNIVNV